MILKAAKDGLHFICKWNSIPDMERAILKLHSEEQMAEHQENTSALGIIQSAEEMCVAAIGTAKLKGKKK